MLKPSVQYSSQPSLLQAVPPKAGSRSHQDKKHKDPLIAYHGCSLEGYTLTHSLGQGQFAKTYEATDSENNPVAIKFIPLLGRRTGLFKRSRLQQALKEANHMKALAGTGTIKLIKSFNLDNKYLCIVMPRAKKTLLSYKRPGLQINENNPTGSPAPQSQLLSDIRIFAWQMLIAFSHLETKKLDHGDIKPANVLLLNGTISSARLGDLDNITAFNKTYSRLPAAKYCAPEVIKTHKAGPKASVYSLSMMMLFMFTGDHIFTSDEHTKVKASQTTLEVKQIMTKARHSYLDFYINMDEAKPIKAQLIAAKKTPSDEFVSFQQAIEKMSAIEFSNRCTIEQAKKLNFFKPLNEQKTAQPVSTGSSHAF